MPLSGSTGKPKGVVHGHAAFPAKIVMDLGLCMDFKAEDRLLWMSDMGWVVGPLIVYTTPIIGATLTPSGGAESIVTAAAPNPRLTKSWVKVPPKEWLLPVAKFVKAGGEATYTLLEGESLVYWLRKLVFRGAWLDHRVKEGLLDVSWEDDTGDFGYAEPEGGRTLLELAPVPSWHDLQFRR